MSHIDDFFRSRLDQMIDLRKPLAERERELLKKRQAIEPIIGHLKSDHGMYRCHLKGPTGDAILPFFIRHFLSRFWRQFTALIRKGELPCQNAWLQIAANSA